MKACALLLLAVMAGCQQTSAEAELFADGTTASGAEPGRLVCDRDTSATNGAKASTLFDEIHLEVSAAKKADGAYPLTVAAKKGGAAVDFPSADRKVVDATGTLELASANLSLRDATPAGRATLKWKGTAAADGLSATGPATLAVPSLERTFPMTCKYEQPKPDCTKHPQKILVLDFKSGWWAGDGGDFFKTILKGLALECESTVTLEYHHILATDAFAGTPGGGTDIALTYAASAYPRAAFSLADPTFQPLNDMMRSPDFKPERKPAAVAGGFGESDWKAYTQIWVLSGSQHDGADLRVDDAFFKAILDQIETSGASVLIGAGYGSITHANAVAGKLGFGDRFATTRPEGLVITAALGVEVASKLTVGDKLKAHPVLTSGVTEIADDVTIAGAPVGGDYLTKLDGFEKLGTNTDGKDSLAFAAQGRKVVLDAGLQRYYAIKGDKHPQTLKLLQNAVRFLAK